MQTEEQVTSGILSFDAELKQTPFSHSLHLFLSTYETDDTRMKALPIHCWISVNLHFTQAKPVAQAYKALKKIYIADIVFFEFESL